MYLMQPPARGAKTRVRVPLQRSSEGAIRHMGDHDLDELRRALRRALRELRVGSPASQIVGRLSRLTRAEQRRRERRRGGPPQAA
jgi:ribosomal protein L29